MTMLPDVAQSDWNGYQSDQFTTDTNQRISSLAPPSSDSLTNPLGTGNAPPPLQPPAEPPPPPEPPLPDVTTENFGGAAATPTRAPIAAPDSVPFPSPAPASSVAPSISSGRGVSGPSDLIAAALNAADDAGVDPNLFVALVNQESSFNPTARSPVGAMGLTQLMPDTARGLGVSDPFDVQQSLMGGAKYLRQMLDNNGGDAVKALAAYNAGQGNLDRYGITGVLDPSFAHGETLKYVDNIMSSVAANQGGVGGATNTPSGGPQLVPDVSRPAGTPSKDISQFGDPQLTAQEAYAACGPAAAVRFAEKFGRNPTLREATDLAKSVGWTPQQGMAGLGSEKALMDKLGIPTRQVNGAQWSTFATEAQTGNPVTISTSGHYFYADGYNPDTGAFHVGRSGLDLKGGAEWMTPAQMTNLMGPVQGGLLADNPQVPQPSTADQQSNPIDWLGKQKDALTSGIGNAVQGATSAASSLFPTPDVTSAMPASMQPTPSDSLTNPLGTGNGPAAPPQPPQTPPAGPLDVVKQKFSDALDALGNAISGSQVYRNVTGTNPNQAALDTGFAQSQQTTRDLTGASAQFPTSVGDVLNAGAGAPTGGEYEAQQRNEAIAGANPLRDVPVVGGATTFAAQTALDPTNLLLMGEPGVARAVGSVAREGAVAAGDVLGSDAVQTALRSGQRAEAEAGFAAGMPKPPPVPENPFQLHTEAGPSRTPITADEAAAHLEDLHARYQANDGRISELENRLSSGSAGRGEFSGTVVRPPWAAGWTDDALRQLAHDNNVNPYQGGWWEQANFVPGTGEMRYDVGQSARRGTGQRKLTPTDMRRELGQLRAEQEQIVAAADHAYANSGGQFYRTEVAPAADLPFDYPQASATSTAAAEVPGPVATTAPASRGSGYQAQAPESVGAPPEAAARPPLDAGFANGADELAAARQAVADLADRFPRMTPGSLRASGPGKRLAELEADAAAHSGKYEVRPTLEPEVASTLTPGSGPLAPPAPPQSADATLRGLVNLAKARGIDTSSIEAQLPRVSEPPITADMVTGKAEPPAPTFEQVQQIAQKYVQQSTERKAAAAAGGRPPTEPPVPPAPPGGGGEPPELFTSSGAPVPIKAGITPEMVQVAHQRIDRAIDPGSPRNYDAHQQLEDMLAHGAAPDQLARFLFGKVEGQTVTPTSLLRTVRTGSLAGGLTTEGKVLLGPVIQTAMRAPVGVIQALIERQPGNIRTGLQGGIAGLAEGAVDALQTLRYGINYRSALGGTAGGGYGFAPGLDVMGSNALKRAIGTAAMGLVRTHGAIADVSASIGRGAARATGATPERAAEVGQQWALRSGKYGTIGQAVSQRIGDLRNVNPAMDVVGQILLPFYRVGYNALTQGVERSPVGLAGTAADVARGRLPASVPSWLRGPYAAGADSAAVTSVGPRLANNMFGVGLAAYGLSQAAAGNITGDKPPTGDPKWSIRVPETAKLGPFESLARRDRNGNLWLPIRTLGPAGEALAQSAILYESTRDGAGNVPEVAARSAAAYVGHVGDESFLNNIANIFGLLGDAKSLYSSSAFLARRAQNELAYQAGSIGKSFIPQDRLAEQIAAAVGTYTSPSSKAASGSATAVPTEAVAPARTTAPTEAPSRRRYTPPARATSTPRTRP